MAMIFTYLLTNMVLLTHSAAVLTNTPELENHVMAVALNNALAVATGWNLDKRLLSTNSVTEFKIEAHTGGYYAWVTFADRYHFFTFNSGCCMFKDKLYEKDSVLTHTNMAAWGSPVSDRHLAWLRAVASEEIKNGKIARRWGAATNLLDIKRARTLAQAALDVSCLPERGLLGRKPRGEQAQWREETGTVWLPADAVKTNSRGGIIEFTGVPPYGKGPLGPWGKKPMFTGPFSDGSWHVSYPLLHPGAFPLPYYKFHWKSGDVSCDIHVSGLISNIVSFSYGIPNWPPPPANYLQLLGLPPNTIFVLRRSTDPPVYVPAQTFPRR